MQHPHPQYLHPLRIPRPMIPSPTLRTPLLLGTILCLVFFLAACDGSDPVSPDPDEDDGLSDHQDAGKVEVYTRGGEEVLIAVWSDEIGWTDADNNPIETIENPIETSAGERLPLRVGGQNASLTVRFFDNQGDEIDFFTEDRVDLTTEEPGVSQQRICSEFTSRYFVRDGQDKVTWPPETHPDAVSDPQNDQFAWWDAEEQWVAIFHCDHVHFYPEEEGTFTVDFLLWHLDHSDDRTDSINFTVEAAE